MIKLWKLQILEKALSISRLSEEAREKVEKELRRLEQMPPLSAEAVVSRNYVDWIISLPWGKRTKDTISIKQAEKILDENHAGLKKVKERIIEFLGCQKVCKTDWTFANHLSCWPSWCWQNISCQINCR